MSWAQLIDVYLGELAERGRRPHTLRGYGSDLADFAGHVSRDVETVDEEVIGSYAASLARLAPATQARKRSAAAGFLRWLAARGDVAGGLAAALSGPGHTPSTPSSPETARPVPAASDVAAVLAVIPRQADRDQLLFGMLVRLGLRPGEALALQVEDFDEPAQCLHVPGWGGTRRRVLVDDAEILMRLVNWIRVTGQQQGPMFHAPGRSVPLRYQSVAERWARYQASAGVTVRLGDLRRFHAAALLAGGVPEWVVRQRLGQLSGPLPVPVGTGADDAIRAWRNRMPGSPPAASRTRRTRRKAG